MKDGALKRVVAMLCVTVAYFGYMLFSYLCTGEVPDGLLFGTVMLILGALAGVDLSDAVKKFKNGEDK